MTDGPRRSAPRVAIRLECEIRLDRGQWSKSILYDLSRTGFRIAWLPRRSSDPKLWIRIPGLQPLTAVIRWHSQSAIGCEFSTPLYEPVFDHLARLAASQMRLSA
jgi:hypothetical protein